MKRRAAVWYVITQQLNTEVKVSAGTCLKILHHIKHFKFLTEVKLLSSHTKFYFKFIKKQNKEGLF